MRLPQSICQLMTFYANKNEQRMANVKFYSEGVNSCCAVNPEVGKSSFQHCVHYIFSFTDRFLWV